MPATATDPTGSPAIGSATGPVIDPATDPLTGPAASAAAGALRHLPAPRQRCIAHLDMDAFFASVEQRDNPAWRGKPLIVARPPQERGVVAAASYEARRYGLHSAMSSHRALQLCPQVILVSPRFEAYRAVSLQIRALMLAWTKPIWM